MVAMRALLLLDVDGVLNAVGGRGLRQGRAVAGGRSWPIRWSPEVVSGVLGWLEQADVHWLTTWGHDANGGLRELLGLPHLPVAGTSGAGTADGPAGTHASVTPAAPDALIGRWWKFDVVRDLVGQAPARPLVWVDDDLAGQRGVHAWMRGHSRSLLVAPDPRTGLTGVQVRQVALYLAALDVPADGR